MARRRSRLRNLTEYAVARSLLVLVRFLPARTVAPTARLFGRLLHRVLGRRREVVEDNLRLAYGDAPDAPDPAVIGPAAFSHLCLSFMELARFPWDAEKAKARINILQPDRLERLQELVKDGVVLAGAHYGGYEVLGMVSPLFGVPCVSVARPLDNPYLERWVRRARERFGQRIIGNRDGIQSVIDAVNDGTAAGILVDLNHRRKRRVWVDFFGTPAATAATAAVIALRTGRPLLSLGCRRGTRPLTYDVEIGATHRVDHGADRKSETRRLLQAVTNEIEQRVRRDPGDWLWTQRRWKTRPEPGELDD